MQCGRKRAGVGAGDTGRSEAGLGPLYHGSRGCRISSQLGLGSGQLGDNQALLGVIKPQTPFQRTVGPLWTSHSIP